MTDLFSSEADPASITFDSLVGEGKKYRDPDTAARSIVEKDNFIEQLKRETAELRTELRSRTNLEELVGKLQPASQTPPPNSQQPPTQPLAATLETPAAQPTDLKTEVARLLEEERSKTGRETNIATARQGLKERFGADYNQTLKSIAEDLNVTEKFLTDMAATSPVGFLKLVDSVKAPDGKAPLTPPATRQSSPLPSSSGRKNKAYFDELRRTDLNKFLSPKVQQEYYKEAMAQGARFHE